MSSCPIARLNLCCNFAKVKYRFCIARYMAQIKRLFMILLMFENVRKFDELLGKEFEVGQLQFSNYCRPIPPAFF